MLLIGRLNIGEYRMHAYIYVPMQEYYWKDNCKYWYFCSKIPNHQSLLLANILSYTVHIITYFSCSHVSVVI